MSEILKEMALTILLRPEAVPSSEAAGAALLLSHVAWNRANGEEFTDHMYRGVIEEMENSNPDFWKELRSKNAHSLIADLIQYKRTHHASDLRKVVSCGKFNDKVRVEWTE